jgi:uncharacterized protein
MSDVFALESPQEEARRIHARVWDVVAHYWRRSALLGHGEDHARRIYETAIRIAIDEGVDILAVGAACYLTDVGLDPEHGRSAHIERSILIARQVIEQIPELHAVGDFVIDAVQWHEAEDAAPPRMTAAASIVRDAETLDRLGYTGIAMTLQYGTRTGRSLYNHADPTCKTRAPSLDTYSLDYVRYSLGLAHLMCTSTGERLARAKTAEIQCFLSVFERMATREAMTYTSAAMLLRNLQTSGGISGE